MKQYSLGISAFISALVGITIDGQIQNSVTVTIWAMIRAMRTVAPSIPYSEVSPNVKRIYNLFSGYHYVSFSQPNFIDLVGCSLTVACYLQKVPWHSRRSNLRPTKRRSKSSLEFDNTQNIFGSNDTCSIIHPGMNCFQFPLQFFPPSFKRSIRYEKPLPQILILSGFICLFSFCSLSFRKARIRNSLSWTSSEALCFYPRIVPLPGWAFALGTKFAWKVRSP